MYFLFVFVFAKKRLEACPQLGNRRCKRKRHGCSCTCSSTEGYMLLTNHSPPRGLQDQTPLPRNTFPSFCHQHGPRVVDGCIALLGERHLPIILSQAGACNRSAHLPQVQHKHTHWLGGTKDFAEETTGDENLNWIVVSRGSHCCLRGVWLPPPFDYYTHLL